MINVMLWGLRSKLVRNAIKKLQDDKIINIKRWMIYGEDEKDDFFRDIENCDVLNNEWRTGKVYNIAEYPSEQITKRIYQHMPEIMQHIARDNEYYRLTINEYLNIINGYINYYYNLLKEKNVELVIFEDVPHGGNCYILYCVAKAMDIKTLFLIPTFECDRFNYCYSIDDIGEYKEVPEYIYQEIKSIKIEEKFEKELEYMKPDEIKKDLGINKGRYFKILKNPLDWFADRKTVLLENFNKYDDISDFIERKLIKCIGEYYSKNLYRLNSLKYARDDVDLNTKYVYFALHLQPEMTTDSLGGMYYDQLLAIEKLRRIIPDDWMIYVKENPKQKNYMRGKYFFKRLSMIPNCKFVSRKYNTYDLLKKSQFVATITGTVGWEAISGGKCALVFGLAWYRKFPGVFKYSDNITYDDIINYKIDHQSVEQAYNELNKKTAEGIYIDYNLNYVKKEIDYVRNSTDMYKFFSYILNEIAI